MILSMTGFGTATFNSNELDIVINIKSVNSKQFDCTLKIPSVLRPKENELKTIIQTVVIRGKVDVSIYIERKENSMTSMINKPLFIAYYNELNSLCDEVGHKEGDLVATIMRHPEIFQINETTIPDLDFSLIEKTLQKAIQEYQSFRKTEGLALAKDLVQRIDTISKNAKIIEAYEVTRIDNKRDKIKTKLAELIGKDSIDEIRLEQEILFYSEKLDITEELVRLAAHCNYFTETIEMDADENGKKLNFISQEIGREINTIGSKSNDFTMQKNVVQCKEELERIKEQINNIL